MCDTLLTIVKPDAIAILRLDTDFYESTRAELSHLFPKVVAGGYVIVDDYYCWKGSQVATDEFLAVHGSEVSLIPRAETGGIMVFKKK